MLARCARVAPARVRASPGSENLISSFFSFCTTDTPATSGKRNEPFAPLMVTESSARVAVTPWGNSTGALAIRDIVALSVTRARYAASGDDAQHLAALARGTRLAVGHHPLRGR